MLLLIGNPLRDRRLALPLNQTTQLISRPQTRLEISRQHQPRSLTLSSPLLSLQTSLSQPPPQLRRVLLLIGNPLLNRRLALPLNQTTLLNRRLALPLDQTTLLNRRLAFPLNQTTQLISHPQTRLEISRQHQPGSLALSQPPNKRSLTLLSLRALAEFPLQRLALLARDPAGLCDLCQQRALAFLCGGPQCEFTLLGRGASAGGVAIQGLAASAGRLENALGGSRLFALALEQGAELVGNGEARLEVGRHGGDGGLAFCDLGTECLLARRSFALEGSLRGGAITGFYRSSLQLVDTVLQIREPLLGRGPVRALGIERLTELVGGANPVGEVLLQGRREILGVLGPLTRERCAPLGLQPAGLGLGETPRERVGGLGALELFRRVILALTFEQRLQPVRDGDARLEVIRQCSVAQADPLLTGFQLAGSFLGRARTRLRGGQLHLELVRASLTDDGRGEALGDGFALLLEQLTEPIGDGEALLEIVRQEDLWSVGFVVHERDV